MAKDIHIISTDFPSQDLNLTLLSRQLFWLNVPIPLIYQSKSVVSRSRHHLFSVVLTKLTAYKLCWRLCDKSTGNYFQIHRKE